MPRPIDEIIKELMEHVTENIKVKLPYQFVVDADDMRHVFLLREVVRKKNFEFNGENRQWIDDICTILLQSNYMTESDNEMVVDALERYIPTKQLETYNP